MTSIRITREQAAAALRAAAKDGTVKVLWSSARGELVLEETAVNVLMVQLAYAALLAYQPGPFGYDLSMLLGLTVFHFDVPMPDQTPAEGFLAEHSTVLLDLMEEDAAPRSEAAYQALVDYLRRRDELEGP